MLTREIQQLKTGPKELANFGRTVGGVFLVLGLWCVFRHKTAGPYLLAPGILLVVCGWLQPRLLKTVYLVWMSLALVLGHFVSTIVLILFFYLIVTPIGLLARLFKKDFLNRRQDRTLSTYWILRPEHAPKPKDNYLQQY